MLSNFCRVESQLLDPIKILTEYEDPINAIKVCMTFFSRLNTTKYKIRDWEEVGCYNVEVFQKDKVYRYYIEA